MLAHVAESFAREGVSIARLTQHLVDGAAALDVVTHTAPSGRVDAALDAIGSLAEVRGGPTRSVRGRARCLRGSLLERYRSSRSLSDSTPLVSLGEGSTPLVRAPRLSERLGSTSG